MTHGHVTPNPDGSKARCGGPALCAECAMELAEKKLPDIYREIEAAAMKYAQEIAQIVPGQFDTKEAMNAFCAGVAWASIRLGREMRGEK